MTEQYKLFIKHYEGLHDGDLSTIGLQPKMDCLGIWTEGYGRAMWYNNKILKGANSKSLAYSLQTIHTEDEAIKAMEEDWNRKASFVKQLLIVPLEGSKFEALGDIAYNCGVGALKNTRLLASINKGACDSSQFLGWDNGINEKGQKVKLAGLTARCKSRQYLWDYGVFKAFN